VLFTSLVVFSNNCGNLITTYLEGVEKADQRKFLNYARLPPVRTGRKVIKILPVFTPETKYTPHGIIFYFRENKELLSIKLYFYPRLLPDSFLKNLILILVKLSCFLLFNNFE
jgi:hypothetical protein